MNGQQVPQGMPQGGNFPQGGPPGGMGGRGFLFGGPTTSIMMIALLAVTCIVLAIAFYQLFRKAGFAGALGLLMLVPVVNLGVALYLAFAAWPVLVEINQLKLQLASAMLTSPPTAPSPAAEVAKPAMS